MQRREAGFPFKKKKKKKKKNAFAQEGSKSYRHSGLVKHGKSSDHTDAAKVVDRREDLNQATEKAQSRRA